MTATLIRDPKFRLTQWVSFISGEGIVQSCKPGATNWTYLVKMPLGLEPGFGRVGPETTVCFDETDLRAA
jgi:hypothetical protein